MLLQKTRILSTHPVKYIILIVSAFVISSSATAKVLYRAEDTLDHDFFTLTSEDIATGVDKHDLRAIYLSALHEVKDSADKNSSIKKMQALANSDISDAKYSLYLISTQIDIAGLSKQEALQYLVEAAEDNYPPAQKKLATLYLFGKGVGKSAEKYHYWQERAAQQGDADAMIYVARSYFAGEGTVRDDTKGFQWVIKALNTQTSRFTDWDMLAQLYEKGRGTPVDLVKAYMCYDLEGTAGIDEKARIAPQMTEAERAEGLRLSQEWQEQYHAYTMPALGFEHQSDGSYRRR